MIRLKDLALRRGGRLLLSQVDLTLHPGWRVGVVGRNGCGKSSLFAALLGQLDLDAGDIERPRGQRVATVAQETPALPDAAIDFVISGDAGLAQALAEEGAARARGDHEAVARAHHRIEELSGYDAHARAGRLLHGLGFAADTHATAVREFSGGWRVRLNLARALMAPSDLLLLDEPTNHLDLDAVVWLEDWLRRYPGTLLVISHDREFLDGIASHIVHLDEGRARLYTGNYTSFERQRAEHLRQQQISHEREQAERAHLQSFIDRFKAKASKARQAQSRVKRLEKLAGTEAVRAQSPFRFSFPVPGRLPSPLLRLDRVDAGYRAADAATDAGAHRVLAAVRFSLEPGERVALLGPNGAGKSTLVKTLVGDLPVLAGERLAHRDLRVGYFAQHTVESLREGVSAIDHLRMIAPGISEQALRNYLGGWNFAGERAYDSVDTFSGGERARLALALIAWHRPNVLLLDEPTNHLDLEVREALADALADFPGALVLVAHDRHLIGLVCDSFWRVADGTVTGFNGDLDDYARWLRSRDPASAAATVTGPDHNADGGMEPDTAQAGQIPGTGQEAASARDRRRAAAEQRAREKPIRERLRAIEARLALIGRERGDLEARLADPQLYAGPPDEVAALMQHQHSLASEQDRLEEEWLSLQLD